MTATSRFGANGRGGDRSHVGSVYDHATRRLTARMLRYRGGTDSGAIVARPIWNTKQAGRLAVGRHPSGSWCWSGQGVLAARAVDSMTRP